MTTNIGIPPCKPPRKRHTWVVYKYALFLPDYEVCTACGARCKKDSYDWRETPVREFLGSYKPPNMTVEEYCDKYGGDYLPEDQR